MEEVTIEDGSMLEDCAVAEVGAIPEEGAVFVDGVIFEDGVIVKAIVTKPVDAPVPEGWVLLFMP